MKKILSATLSLATILSLSSNAFAQQIYEIPEIKSNDTFVIQCEENIKTYTSKNGIKASTNISEETINNLPDSVKLELSNENCTLVSVKETYIDFETKTETLAVMPTSDFRMIVSVARLEDEYGKEDKDCFKLIATGNWIVNPNFEFTDCIGLTWSDDFTLYSTEGYTLSYGSYKKYSTMTLNKVVPEQGFAYDANLKLFDRQDEITIIGKVYKDDSEGSANVCGSYGHVTITPLSVDVSFSSGKDISFSVGFGSILEEASPDFASFDY